MPELKDRMHLYHGSFYEVRMPDLSKCARYKDFGQGFYLTSSREQARGFAKISTRKAVGMNSIPPQRYGVVSEFTFADPNDLTVFDYPTADVNWRHCVAGHRRNRGFSDVIEAMKDYDIISGNIAGLSIKK